MLHYWCFGWNHLYACVKANRNNGDDSRCLKGFRVRLSLIDLMYNDGKWCLELGLGCLALIFYLDQHYMHWKKIKEWENKSNNLKNLNSVKSVRIRSYSGPHFSCIFPHSDWIRRDTQYLSVFCPNAGKCQKNAEKMRTRITPNASTFYAVMNSTSFFIYILSYRSVCMWTYTPMAKNDSESVSLRNFPLWISVFCSNAGRCEPDKLQIQSVFTQGLAFT